MFTGLIEATGEIRNISRRYDYRVLAIASSIDAASISLGESIACDGACLTVTKVTGDLFVVEASPETVTRTILGEYKRGTLVNLERALQMGDRLGGHLVSGHVDDIGTVDYARRVGESIELAVTFDRRYDSLVIEKGSIAINGVSLTVNAVGDGRLCVNLIPHTVGATTVDRLRPGNKVNLEFDMIGKYILKSGRANLSSGLTKDKLIESGW